MWGGGGGGSGVRDMDPALTGKFFYSHILRPILHKSAVVLSLDNSPPRSFPVLVKSFREECFVLS